MHTIEEIKTAFRAGRHQEALAACEALCQANGQDPALVKLTATMYGLVGDYANSARRLRDLVAAVPDDTEALFNLGVCEREMRNFAAARTCYLAYTQRHPKEWEGWVNLAECQVQLGEAKGAIASADNALKFNQKAVPAWIAKGEAQLVLNQNEEALKSFDRANALVQSAAVLLKTANALVRLGRHDQALDRMGKALKADAGFLPARLQRAELLARLGRTDAALNDYTAYLTAAPENEDVLKAVTEMLVGLRRGQEAIDLCRKALEKYPDSLTAKLGISWVIDRVVPNWHVPMMNEHRRNNAYFEGMKTHVTPDSLVFEIGAGSGLLSMMAARLGARRVVTCEGAPIIAAKAQKIVATNGFADTVTVLSKPSFEVQLPEELPEQADVLVHEIFSSGLIEEHVLPALEDAKARLLKPGAAIVPARSSLMIALVGGEGIGNYFHVSDPFGFDISEFNEITPKKLPVFRADLNPQLLSDDVEAFHFDFVRDSQWPAEHKTIEVTATEAGVCYGVIQWIRLDMDGSTTYENHPRDNVSVSGWQHLFYRFDAPITLEAGQTVRLSAAHDRATPWFDLAAN